MTLQETLDRIQSHARDTVSPALMCHYMAGARAHATGRPPCYVYDQERMPGGRRNAPQVRAFLYGYSSAMALPYPVGG